MWPKIKPSESFSVKNIYNTGIKHLNNSKAASFLFGANSSQDSAWDT